jgi:hypothetical protein
MTVIFRTKNASESWNEPSTHYNFGLSPKGGWGVSVVEDYQMPGYGFCPPEKRKGKYEKLAEGVASDYKDTSEGRFRIRVQGSKFTVWFNDEKLVEHTHKGGEIDPIPYGGFGIQWRYESMGWISNVKVKNIQAAKEPAPTVDLNACVVHGKVDGERTDFVDGVPESVARTLPRVTRTVECFGCGGPERQAAAPWLYPLSGKYPELPRVFVEDGKKYYPILGTWRRVLGSGVHHYDENGVPVDKSVKEAMPHHATQVDFYVVPAAVLRKPGLDVAPAETADRQVAVSTTDEVIATLRRLFEELSARPPVPKPWDGTMRYCTGVNHSYHRILVHGFSFDEPDDRPPADGRPHAVFYYDPDGQVRLVVQHISGQAPYVSDYVAYHQNQPVARINYSRGRVAYGDFVHYEKGNPFLSCRILPDGRAVLVKKLSEE